MRIVEAPLMRYLATALAIITAITIALLIRERITAPISDRCQNAPDELVEALRATLDGNEGTLGGVRMVKSATQGDIWYVTGSYAVLGWHGDYGAVTWVTDSPDGGGAITKVGRVYEKANHEIGINGQTVVYRSGIFGINTMQKDYRVRLQDRELSVDVDAALLSRDCAGQHIPSSHRDGVRRGQIALTVVWLGLVALVAWAMVSERQTRAGQISGRRPVLRGTRASVGPRR